MNKLTKTQKTVYELFKKVDLKINKSDIIEAYRTGQKSNSSYVKAMLIKFSNHAQKNLQKQKQTVRFKNNN